MKTPLLNDIDREVAKVQAGGQKPRLLLHACCGPCSAGALNYIAPYFDLTLFYYNPNILPHEEFLRRLDALQTVADHFGVPVLVPDQYSQEFTSKTRGLESLPEGGSRCTICFSLRLDKTAEYLALHRDSYDCFATTLTLSPHKNAPLINSVGASVAASHDVTYLSSDFKKKDGFLNSIRLSSQLDIYRQSYCGCTFNQ